jgi:hypothetical protein
MVWVVTIWTAGVILLWVISDRVLNPGVTDEDIRECVEEGFIPAEECEETLQQLEDDEDPVFGIGATLLVWLAGALVLMWLLRPPPESR